VNTFNTPQNRAKFVARFGCKHPDGPYAVDVDTATIILHRFDMRYDDHQDPLFLWTMIMQNRDTYMLGEIHLIEAKARGVNIGIKRYATIGAHVTTAIYTFIDELK